MSGLEVGVSYFDHNLGGVGKYYIFETGSNLGSIVPIGTPTKMTTVDTFGATGGRTQSTVLVYPLQHTWRGEVDVLTVEAGTDVPRFHQFTPDTFMPWGF